MQLILASNSPRRRQLLKELGFEFTVLSSGYEEKSFSDDPIQTAITFAYGKAEDVFSSLSDKSGSVVLGADTVVYSEKKILGKPKSDNEAFMMIKSLSNKTHVVITGYAVITASEVFVGYDSTEVTFLNVSDESILEYVKSGLYKGKAGGYGIQDPYPLVKKHVGSLNNVIGLPTERIAPILKQFIK